MSRNYASLPFRKHMSESMWTINVNAPHLDIAQYTSSYAKGACASRFSFVPMLRTIGLTWLKKLQTEKVWKSSTEWVILTFRSNLFKYHKELHNSKHWTSNMGSYRQ